MEPSKYILEGKFHLESGGYLQNPVVAYHTFGKLNKKKDNVIWVCHALTANSNVADWWGDLVGPQGLLNTDEYFIVSANMLGSCYGSTGPVDINPETEKPYYYDFPLVTMKDIVKAHLCLKEYLGLNKIKLVMGGSCGGNQVLEFCLQDSNVENAFVIASSARESAWSIAIHTSQRMAIEADRNWGKRIDSAGSDGLKAARGMGLLSYRTIEAYKKRQTDLDEKIDNFKASSYIEYQGEKLVKRFNAHSYWHMTKTLDTHNIGRERGGSKKALNSIKSRLLVIGIDSDQLIPADEQEFIANNTPNSVYHLIHSDYGHDGFLIEQKKIKEILKKFLQNGI